RRRHTRFSRDWSSDVCSSDLPVTVTVCGTFQFPEVNTSEAGDTLPSPVSVLVMDSVTSAPGRVVRTIVKVSLSPSSDVTRLPFEIGRASGRERGELSMVYG